MIKIGYTKNVSGRMKQLRNTSPEPLHLLKTIKGSIGTEKVILLAFGADRQHGEWFKATPKLLAFIQSLDEACPYEPKDLLLVQK